MKKLFFSLILCAITISASAQVMRAQELEKYAVGRYGQNWTEAASNLKQELNLDKNNSLSYSQTIDCGNQTKEQLYIVLNHWFTATFNDANSVIKLNEKESGAIVAEGYINEIATHKGGMNSYIISITPIIKVDIKDYKVRVSYTVQYYNVTKNSGDGLIGLMSEKKNVKTTYEKWAIEDTFPFKIKDKYNAKKSSSKALVMTHAYSNVIMDKIEETAKHGLIGNEGEEW